MPSILRPLQLDESPPETPSLAKSRRREIVPEETPLRRPRSFPKPAIDLPAFSFIPLKEYLLHLPILLIGLGFYAVVLFVLNTIEPKLVQNVWVPNSYAPFLILVGIAHFCFFSYLFLNTRRGFLTSLYLTTLLFLKLQQVLTPQLILWTALVFIVMETIFVIFHRIFLRFHPKLTLPKMPTLPTWHKQARSVPQDFVEKHPLKPLPVPKKPPHRHGRKRKHHFFGK